MSELKGRYGSESRTSLNGDAPCQDCGATENIIWWTDNVFWNAVCPDEGILCIPCFARRAEAAGFRPSSWRVIPEFDWVRVEKPHGGFRECAECGGPTGQNGECIEHEQTRGEVTFDE